MKIEGWCSIKKLLLFFHFFLTPIISFAVCPPQNLKIDGGKVVTTNPPCSDSVPAGAFDWHPGHYIATPADTNSTDITNVVKFINARPYLRGLIIRPYWKSLEVGRGSYDFSLIDQAIKELSSGKYVWVQLQTAIFNNAAADANSLLPTYLTTAEFDGGAYDDGTHVKTKVWNAAVISRKIELMKALATKYNNTEKFEGVLTGETAMSLTTNEGTSGYSPSALATQLSHLMISARKLFTKKNLMIYVNFISGSGGSNYFQPILDAAREAKYVVGGPDSTYLDPTTGREYINGTLGKIDYRGKIGIQVGDQASGLGSSEYVVEDLINWGIKQGANYFFWQYMPYARNFNPIMDYLSKNPNSYVSRYPAEF